LFLAFALAMAIPHNEGHHRANFAGQKVVRAIVDTAEKANLIDVMMLDVWANHEGNVWDIRVKNDMEMELLYAAGIHTSEFINDLQEMVDMQLSLNEAAQKREGNEWFESYHELDEIIQFYDDLAEQYPNLVTRHAQVFETDEGRIMPFYVLSSAANPGRLRRIYWQGGIHAREWIAPATLAYQYFDLVTTYGSDNVTTFILDNFEIIIVPVVNPDGYAFSWDGDRMWRKNRHVNVGSVCLGVDLNRNYDSNWGGGGSSTSPCSDTYMGDSISSEAETTGTSTLFTSVGPIEGAIDFHSYSQLVLRPYGDTRANPPHETEMKASGDGIAAAIRAQSGKIYTSQKSIELYVTTGTASDWFYVNKVRPEYTYGITIELRDTGAYGFLLPPDQILPTALEINAAMRWWIPDIYTRHA